MKLRHSFVMVIATLSVLLGSLHVAAQETMQVEVIPVNTSTGERTTLEADDWTLQFAVKEQKVYVECIVPNFSLSNKEEKGDGYLQLKVDGQQAGKMDQAAFIIQGLPQGKHEVAVQPVKHDGSDFGEEVTFEVSIPTQ